MCKGMQCFVPRNVVRGAERVVSRKNDVPNAVIVPSPQPFIFSGRSQPLSRVSSCGAHPISARAARVANGTSNFLPLPRPAQVVGPSTAASSRA